MADQKKSQIVSATTAKQNNTNQATGHKSSIKTASSYSNNKLEPYKSDDDNNSESSGQQQNERVNKRKGSTVSFQENCDMFEVDLKKAIKPKSVEKPPLLRSLRFPVVILALVSPFVVTYSKTIINFAITDMIHPDFAVHKSAHKSTNTTVSEGGDKYFDHDNSCPVSEEDRVRLVDNFASQQSRARDDPSEKFAWDTVKQGTLKAAFSMGHVPLQVMGGRLSENYGSHWIMSINALGIGICCLAAPLLASIHFYLIVGDLVLLGILGSFMTPSLITLFSNWLTPSEKSIMLSFYLVFSRLGYALSSLLAGLLFNANLSWKYLFYTAGWTGLTFSCLFFFCARSRPQDHPFIQQEELNYLASKNLLVREALSRAAEAKKPKQSTEMVEMKSAEGETVAKSEQVVAKAPARTGAPWFAILTNVPVWAFVATKFCVKLAGDTVQVELPTYFNRVMHMPAKENGIVNAANYVIFSVSCILVGALAKIANKKHPFGMSKTAVRKLFQCTASFGVSIVLLGVAFSVCHNTTTIMLLMLLFFLTTFGTGGEAQIPMDISERYCGTIHAIGSSLAISGTIQPLIVGFLIKDSPADKDSWKFVWMIASAIAATGGLIFLIFGDATIQPFDSIQDDKKGDVEAGEIKKDQLKGNGNKAFEPDEGNLENKAPNDTRDDEPTYRESSQI